ncbi:MAG: hypothetical protein WCT23_08845 [Candidatus Neomarinimicrobiota bacterium]|jgi:hypothetical protein
MKKIVSLLFLLLLLSACFLNNINLGGEDTIYVPETIKSFDKDNALTAEINYTLSDLTVSGIYSGQVNPVYQATYNSSGDIIEEMRFNSLSGNLISTEKTKYQARVEGVDVPQRVITILEDWASRTDTIIYTINGMSITGTYMGDDHPSEKITYDSNGNIIEEIFL